MEEIKKNEDKIFNKSFEIPGVELHGVDLTEFGIPEAMWHLTVEGFTAVVTMDSHGNSLHKDVDKSSLDKLALFKDKVFS